MFSCPGCKSVLKKVNMRGGVFWACPSCDGRVVSMGIVRKVCPSDMVNFLWQKARAGKYIEKRDCPICQQKPHLHTGSARSFLGRKNLG